MPHTSPTKELLAAAARDGQVDGHWKADGVDRLYFHNPKDVNSAGYAEVARVDPASDETPPEPPYVKIEIWVAPQLGAEVIALVTGATESLEERLRYELKREVIKEAEKAAEERAKAEADEAAATPPAPTVAEGHRVQLEASKQQIADAARSAELKDLIAAQGDDEE